MERKVVVITGASSGIGAELAREYAKRNFNLVLAARRMDKLQYVQQELRAAVPNTEILLVNCDVRNHDDVQKLSNAAIERFGRINSVVANAGFGMMGRVESLQISDYRKQFETNVFGVLETVKVTLSELKKTKGQVVIIGSGMSYLALPGASAYSMSKFAVKAFADSLRSEVFSDGVTVTLVCPGVIATEFNKVMEGFRTSEAASKMERFRMPLSRAARQIMRGIECRRAEVHVTLHSKFGVWMQRHFPIVVRKAMAHVRI